LRRDPRAKSAASAWFAVLSWRVRLPGRKYPWNKTASPHVSKEIKPLYLWLKGQKPGDTMGDVFSNIWHMAMP